MSEYILYSTEGCHLCDDARQLVKEQAPDVANSLQVTDIAYDDALYERYKWSIPVLVSPDGRELFWPFDAGQLERFIG